MGDADSILALDVGDRRVGVARASRLAKLPEPLTVLVNDTTVLERIKQLVAEQQAALVVVGLPRNLSGQDTAQTFKTRQFIERLSRILPVPLSLVDEALTSVQAEAWLQSRSRRYSKADIDAAAACLILEDYFRSSGKEVHEIPAE